MIRAAPMTRDEAVRILRSPEGKEETRRIYALRRAVDFAEITVRAGGIDKPDAEALVDTVAALAEQLFEGSQETFRIVYGRRLRRVLEEVYGPND
jgi:hypothetical protein